jgi:phosphohistidine phosphatase
LKTLHLLRHAKAAEGDIDATDHARPLAKRGINDARAMAAYLKDQTFAVERVYCSSSRRTKETYELMTPALGGAPVAFKDRLYLVDSVDLVDFIQTLPDSASAILLLGHNPTYPTAALTLTKDATKDQDAALQALGQKFPTGAMCSLRFDVDHWRDVKHGQGTLTRFISPKDVEART